jgi:Fe-S cluster assembly iron-binding protein IscA
MRSSIRSPTPKDDEQPASPAVAFLALAAARHGAEGTEARARARRGGFGGIGRASVEVVTICRRGASRFVDRLVWCSGVRVDGGTPTEIPPGDHQDTGGEPTMLTISPKALAVIRRVTAHPRLQVTSGLRIGRRHSSRTPLEVRAVPRPRPGDRVVEHEGARLFLGPDAAQRLDGRELDAVTEPDGRVQFVLRGVEA